MFLSPKTVEASLTRIYRKIGVRSRAGLASRFAATGHIPARRPVRVATLPEAMTSFDAALTPSMSGSRSTVEDQVVRTCSTTM